MFEGELVCFDKADLGTGARPADELGHSLGTSDDVVVAKQQKRRAVLLEQSVVACRVPDVLPEAVVGKFGPAFGENAAQSLQGSLVEPGLAGAVAESYDRVADELGRAGVVDRLSQSFRVSKQRASRKAMGDRLDAQAGTRHLCFRHVTPISERRLSRQA